MAQLLPWLMRNMSSVSCSTGYDFQAFTERQALQAHIKLSLIITTQVRQSMLPCQQHYLSNKGFILINNIERLLRDHSVKGTHMVEGRQVPGEVQLPETLSDRHKLHILLLTIVHRPCRKTPQAESW